MVKNLEDNSEKRKSFTERKGERNEHERISQRVLSFVMADATHSVQLGNFSSKGTDFTWNQWISWSRLYHLPGVWLIYAGAESRCPAVRGRKSAGPSPGSWQALGGPSPCRYLSFLLRKGKEGQPEPLQAPSCPEPAGLAGELPHWLSSRADLDAQFWITPKSTSIPAGG